MNRRMSMMNREQSLRVLNDGEIFFDVLFNYWYDNIYKPARVRKEKGIISSYQAAFIVKFLKLNKRTETN